MLGFYTYTTISVPMGTENPNSSSHTCVVSSLLTEPSTQSIMWLLRRPLLCQGGNVLERGKHRIREFTRSLCLWSTRVKGDPGKDRCGGDSSTHPKNEMGGTWYVIEFEISRRGRTQGWHLRGSVRLMLEVSAEHWALKGSRFQRGCDFCFGAGGFYAPLCRWGKRTCL